MQLTASAAMTEHDRGADISTALSLTVTKRLVHGASALSLHKSLDAYWDNAIRISGSEKKDFPYGLLRIHIKLTHLY